MNIPTRVSLVLLLALACDAWGGEPAAYRFRFIKPIEIGPFEEKEERLVAILLDDDVYAGTDEGLFDIRVLDETGQAVPYLKQRLPAAGPPPADDDERNGDGEPSTENGKQYSVEMTDEKQKPSEGITWIELHSRRQPLTSFTLQTPDRNFRRRARVQVPSRHGTRIDWHTISEATLSRIDFRDVKQEQLTIRFGEVRRQRYRIVIENGDSPPLAISSVRARGPIYRLVLLAAPSQQYRLYYGCSSAEPPDYDTAALATLLRRGYEPTPALLGDERENPAYGEPPGEGVSRLLKNPLVLGGLIVLLVALLGWGLYGAVRRVERSPDR